jgi:phosphatidylglycerophosphate synthase
MSLRTSPIAPYYYRLLENWLLPVLKHINTNPNQLTLVGLALAAAVPPGFYLHPAIGFVLMGFSGVADSLDGVVAKNQGSVSRFGAFLDSTSDRVSDFLYLFGFWILFWDSQWFILSSALIFASTLLTVMISYVKSKVESLGGDCNTGLMERGWRTVYLLFWALLICILPATRPIILWIGLILFFGLTFLTVLQRIWQIRTTLNE